MSRKTVARDCHGCSSRRTMSSPTRAELRQWTRRRSSPRRYSRTVTSSALPVAKARGRLSPDPVHAPPSGMLGRVHRARGDGEPGGGVEGAAELDEAERVGHPHRHRTDLELSAQLRAHLVRRVPAPAVAESLEHEARSGAQDVGESLLEQQHAGGRARLVGDRELDGRRLPGDDELRRDRADEGEAVARPPDPPGGEQRKRGDQHADAHDRGVPDDDRGDDRRDAGSEERPSADGQCSECLTHGCRVGRVESDAGDRHRLHDPGQDRGGGAPAHRRLDVGKQPVREHRRGDAVDVVGQDVVAALGGGDGLGRPHQVERRAGRGAEVQVVAGAGRGGERDGVAVHGGGDVHAGRRSRSPCGARRRR